MKKDYYGIAYIKEIIIILFPIVICVICVICVIFKRFIQLNYHILSYNNYEKGFNNNRRGNPNFVLKI